ncbi:hypothetical protein DES42_102270 [Zavarzinia compransoris]|uniref:Uncharacterized protein n=2 Tax=Zavarzinia compransoris TaxID=1264899 RepID=A0A317EEZ3_9PROT|nr:hypothetical protein DKG75_04060 [Zavarzinia compransoris]TDP47973.1 hypothetical protein DES42_102270 [Zavarzinia compransoris]
MQDMEAFADVHALPEPPHGWRDFSYSILLDGRLAIVRQGSGLHDDGTAGPAGDNAPRSCRVHTFDGSREDWALDVRGIAFPFVSRLADGRWLLVDGLAGHEALSGHLFAADGSPLSSLRLGARISNVLCAPDNSIWVNYSDEGVYAGRLANGDWPLSTGGIVRFSPEGRVLGSLMDKIPMAWGGDNPMSLIGNECWVHGYPKPQLVRMAGDDCEIFPCPVENPGALAGDGRFILLARRFPWEASFSLHERQGGQLALVGEWSQGAGAIAQPRLLQGHGDLLHIVEGGRWIKVSTGAFRDFLAHSPRRAR